MLAITALGDGVVPWYMTVPATHRRNAIRTSG
jgi:hypothetical protein